MKNYELVAIRDAADRLEDIDNELAFKLISIVKQYNPFGSGVNCIYNNLLSKNGYISVSLIGNCQMHAISSLLESNSRKIKVRQKIIAQNYLHDFNYIRQLELSNFIITHNISDEFQWINTTYLVKRFGSKVITIPNLYFKGYHPEWVMLPKIGNKRLKCITGEYHNEIVISGFLNGKKPEEVVLELSKHDYKKLYLKVFKKSIEEFKSRITDISMYEELKRYVSDHQKKAFHTFNHPTKEILSTLACKIVEFLGDKVVYLNHEGECLNSIVLPDARSHDRNIVVNGSIVDQYEYVKSCFDIYKNNHAILDFYSLSILNGDLKSLLKEGEHLYVGGSFYCRTKIFNKKKPIIITFHYAQNIPSALDVSNYLDDIFGFNFCKKNFLNVISISPINQNNWYRNSDVHDFLEYLSKELDEFPLKIGYGSSMGGYAVAAFSNLLNLNRMLLLNPISTLDKNKSPFDNRFNRVQSMWEGKYSDAVVTTVEGVLIYDPLCSEDKNHAKRFGSNIKIIPLIGAGHNVPRLLSDMGVLKNLILDYIREGHFRINFKLKRLSHFYYFNMDLYAKENTQRKMIINANKVKIKERS